MDRAISVSPWELHDFRFDENGERAVLLVLDTRDNPEWQAYVASNREMNGDGAFPVPSLLVTGYYNATKAMLYSGY